MRRSNDEEWAVTDLDADDSMSAREPKIAASQISSGKKALRISCGGSFALSGSIASSSKTSSSRISAGPTIATRYAAIPHAGGCDSTDQARRVIHVNHVQISGATNTGAMSRTATFPDESASLDKTEKLHGEKRHK